MRGGVAGCPVIQRNRKGGVLATRCQNGGCGRTGDHHRAARLVTDMVSTGTHGGGLLFHLCGHGVHAARFVMMGRAAGLRLMSDLRERGRGQDQGERNHRQRKCGDARSHINPCDMRQSTVLIAVAARHPIYSALSALNEVLLPVFATAIDLGYSPPPALAEPSIISWRAIICSIMSCIIDMR